MNIRQILYMFSKAYVRALPNTVLKSGYELSFRILAGSIFDDTSKLICMFLKAYVEAIPNTVPNSGYELSFGILARSIFDDTSRLI